MDMAVKQNQAALQNVSSILVSLDPKAVLSRGYSITRTIPEAVVVFDSKQVKTSQQLEILLAKGTLTVDVKRKTE
jgi:exodeoxyribonuclease VII large subunit